MAEKYVIHTQASAEQRYRLDLAYHGGPFEGWQSQPSRNTVQDHLEKALATILREEVRVVGASRTDTGVHAEHQVAAFQSSQTVDPRRLVKGLNHLLGKSIKIWSCRPVDHDFHPIRDSVGKLYRYRLWLGAGSSPFVHDFVWPVAPSLDIEKLSMAAQHFQGTFDFRSFCASDSTVKSTTRTIHEIWVNNQNPLIEIYIYGDGFLKQMVRSIVGTLVEVAQGRRAINDISAIIKQKDRTSAGLTAPAKGLSLVQVFFEQQASCQARFGQKSRAFAFWIPDNEQMVT